MNRYLGRYLPVGPVGGAWQARVGGQLVSLDLESTEPRLIIGWVAIRIFDVESGLMWSVVCSNVVWYYRARQVLRKSQKGRQVPMTDH